jgi:hypothetical protein
VKNLLNLPMHTARIPPVDPAPAAITAALAMHTGHILRSSNASMEPRGFRALPYLLVDVLPAIVHVSIFLEN